MTVYTVHEPRRLTGDPARDAEKYAFVRDGFHVWAFILGPFWMLWHRMWLVLLGYVLLIVALEVGLALAGVSGLAHVLVGLAVALLVGFEAGTLRRWTLRKRRQVDVVVGGTVEEAERRFFDSWIARDALPAYPAHAATGAASHSASDVIGLFPEPRPRS